MIKEISNKPVYTISTAARLLGISIPTLRMYENEGLIIPFKNPANTDCIRKWILKELGASEEQ